MTTAQVRDHGPSNAAPGAVVKLEGLQHLFGIEHSSSAEGANEAVGEPVAVEHLRSHGAEPMARPNEAVKHRCVEVWKGTELRGSADRHAGNRTQESALCSMVYTSRHTVQSGGVP